MSSIFGILNFDHKNVTDEIQLMKASLHQWASDTSNVWIEESSGLGNILLLNTPESIHEKLPYYNEISDLCITADARIDNKDDLYRNLDIKPSQQIIPDSELILLAYQKYGERCTEYLIGDFAFAIWDGKKQALFCARDQMGVKPFFYYCNEQFFAFATEKKGLLNLPGIDCSINQLYFYKLVVSSAAQNLDDTLYLKIKRLPPSHQLVISKNKKQSIRQYWDLDANKEIHFSNQTDYYDAFREHIEIAIKCRVRSHFPIGVELSGGMDSSGITGVASHFLKFENKELIAISNTLPRYVTDQNELDKSDRKWIDAVVEFNHITHSIITEKETTDDIFDGFDFSLFVDDGLENWHQFWQMPIRKAAKEANIRTLLSGFPGDEMVTYRGKYYMLDYLDKKQYLNYWLAKKKFPGLSKFEPFLSYELKYKIHTLKNRLGLYNKDTRKALEFLNVPKGILNQLGDADWLTNTRKEQFLSYRHFQKHRYLRNHLPERMESETRYGQYFGFEPRFPFADIRLTQYYLSMPNYLKYEGVLHRTAYRKALHKYMPQVVLERDCKTGGMGAYTIPLADETQKNALELSRLNKHQEFLQEFNGHKLFKRNLQKGDRVSLLLLKWLKTNSF